MSEAYTIGLDIAKNKFQVHGEDRQGKKVFNKQLARKDVLPFFANHQQNRRGGRQGQL